jgi:hypothetical protein
MALQARIENLENQLEQVITLLQQRFTAEATPQPPAPQPQAPQAPVPPEPSVASGLPGHPGMDFSALTTKELAKQSLNLAEK